MQLFCVAPSSKLNRKQVIKLIKDKLDMSEGFSH